MSKSIVIVFPYPSNVFKPGGDENRRCLLREIASASRSSCVLHSVLLLFMSSPTLGSSMECFISTDSESKASWKREGEEEEEGGHCKGQMRKPRDRVPSPKVIKDAAADEAIL
jgi:hypothetical protein